MSLYPKLPKRCPRMRCSRGSWWFCWGGSAQPPLQLVVCFHEYPLGLCHTPGSLHSYWCCVPSATFLPTLLSSQLMRSTLRRCTSGTMPLGMEWVLDNSGRELFEAFFPFPQGSKGWHWRLLEELLWLSQFWGNVGRRCSDSRGFDGCPCHAGDSCFFSRPVWSRWSRSFAALLPPPRVSALHCEFCLSYLGDLPPWTAEPGLGCSDRGADLHGHHLCFSAHIGGRHSSSLPFA